MHLNLTGTSCLAKNRLSSIISFWKVTRCPVIINENNIEHEHPSVLIARTNLKKWNLKDLTNIRLKNRSRPIIGQLNINSIRNKFDFLCAEISPSLGLLRVSEKKLDDSFPTTQFLMNGFCKNVYLWKLISERKNDLFVTPIILIKITYQTTCTIWTKV